MKREYFRERERKFFFFFLPTNGGELHIKNNKTIFFFTPVCIVKKKLMWKMILTSKPFKIKFSHTILAPKQYKYLREALLKFYNVLEKLSF